MQFAAEKEKKIETKNLILSTILKSNKYNFSYVCNSLVKLLIMDI